MTSRTSRIALVACLGALAFACSSNKNDDQPDGGDTSTTNPDGGSSGVDAGDGKCHADEACKPNEYCQISTGQCLAAKPCSSNEQCDSEEEGDYCAYGGCFCDTARNGGSCRPRFHPCQACTRDVECGTDPFIYLDYTATCVADQGGEKVCLPVKPLCPPGYLPGSGPNCQPAGGKCGAASPCTKDEDCDATGERPVCDLKRGFCIPPCVFNYQQASSDCPGGQTCHVVARLLTAGNPNFGGGKCGPPCDSGAEPTTCDSGLTCETDGDPLLNQNGLPKRCRPTPPKCVRDDDCPGDPGSHSKGFCDRGTLECSTGCRRESDCDSGYHCLANQCVQKTCIENGGAAIACNRNFFCCGEAGSPDCPTGVNQGECYEAPNPPWCEICQGGDGEIHDPPSPKSERPQQSRCWKTGDAQTPLMWHSCKKTATDGTSCPRGFRCEQNLWFCDQDSDCGATGKCGQIQTGLGTFRACTCAGGESCPNGSGCNLKDDQGKPIACDGYWCNISHCLNP